MTEILEIYQNSPEILQIQQGIKGDAGNSLTVVAGENIVSFKPVKIHNGLLYYFDSENIVDYGKCIGIAKTSGNSGDSIEVVALGKLTVSQTLTIGSQYFANGTSLSLSEGTILSQNLGIATNTNDLFVKIEQCLLR